MGLLFCRFIKGITKSTGRIISEKDIYDIRREKGTMTRNLKLIR